jgi:hypothetical protein
VATSVIEVGIDVPNATVMLVEDADRYGISQLHQLRGRIGRGEHASLCLLFGASKESARLRALAGTTDGFELAEIDLRLCGEGELAGVRQSGAAQFRFAELPRDAELMERARRHAERIGEQDPALVAPEHALLAEALLRRYGAEAAAPIRACGSSPASCAAGRSGLRAVATPARPPTACARRCSRSSARSTECGCSTCSPAPARSRWRRCRAGPPRRR